MVGYLLSNKSAADETVRIEVYVFTGGIQRHIQKIAANVAQRTGHGSRVCVGHGVLLGVGVSDLTEPSIQQFLKFGESLQTVTSPGLLACAACSVNNNPGRYRLLQSFC